MGFNVQWVTKLLVVILVSLIAMCMGCAGESNYRGVPSAVWHALTAEQKQLIVERSYQDEMSRLSS